MWLGFFEKTRRGTPPLNSFYRFKSVQKRKETLERLKTEGQSLRRDFFEDLHLSRERERERESSSED
jgi:hypothetical protein